MEILNAENLQRHSGGPLYRRIEALLREHLAKNPDADFLPFELELAAMLGVSRQSVRRALASLRDGGLIETVKRRGSRILRRPGSDRGPGPGSGSAPGSGRGPVAAPSANPLANRTIGFLLSSDRDQRTPTAFWPWQLAEALEKRLCAAGASLELFNLRFPRRAGNPAEAAAALDLSRISCVLVHDSPGVPAAFWGPYLRERGIKPILLYHDFIDLGREPKLIVPGCDFLAPNSSEIFWQTLEQSYRNVPGICAVVHANAQPWFASRAELLRRFADQYAIPLRLLSVGSAAKKSLRDSQLIQQVRDALLNRPDELRPGRLVVAANDIHALGVQEALESLGLEHALPYLGFDNSPAARNHNISSFGIDFARFADSAMCLLRDFFRDPPGRLARSSGELVPCLYIKRRSTR